MLEANPRVQSWAGFKSDLLAAAKGQPAPASAGGLVVESGQALMRLLTPENRELLRVIRDEKPPSVAALARITHRAEPNLPHLGQARGGGPGHVPPAGQAARAGVAGPAVLAARGPVRSQ